MSVEIVVSGPLPKPEIELSSAAFEARRVALAKAEACTAINGVEDLDGAAAALTAVASLVRSVEGSRKEVKAPVLEVGKRIDSIAKEFMGPLEKEKGRLETLVGSYQEAQKRKAERERQEAAEAQAKALAEMQEKQAEALAAGDEAAADAARAEAADKIAASQIAVTNAEGPKPDGIVTRTTWDFEVCDLQTLFKARPDLCIVTPNNAAIRAIVKATNGQQIPGVRVWQKSAAIVRGAAAVKAEDYDY